VAEEKTQTEDEVLIEQEPIFQFFGFKHLRSEELQVVSSKFHMLAAAHRNVPRPRADRGPADLEAKDAAVRAVLYK
jgi:hypothetical protein